MCEQRECAERVVSLPTTALPRCTAATRRCVDACTTSTCIWSCIDADTMPALDGVNCDRCIGHQQVACSSTHTCSDEWSDYACCWDTNCRSSADPVGCGELYCGSPLSRWQSCFRATPCAYITAPMIQQCFAL
jgi:hypothetical protein